MANRVPGSRRDAELAVLIELWVRSYGSENTRSAYAGDLRAFNRWCDGHGRQALRATTPDIAAYLAWCGDLGASDATLARRRSALDSFFGFARERDARDKNPAAAVESLAPARPSMTARLAARDAQALLRASDRIGSKTAALVRLLMLDGLRLGEVLAAEVGDFQRATTPAGLMVHRRDRRRTVPLTAPTARRLREYVGRRRGGPLLLSDTPGREGTRLSRFGADYLLKEAARAARLNVTISANALRRRYVAAAANAGTHIDDIRDHVGHRDVRTTRRYLDPDLDQTALSPPARPKRR